MHVALETDNTKGELTHTRPIIRDNNDNWNNIYRL